MTKQSKNRSSIQDKRRTSLREMEVPKNTHNVMDDYPDDWQPPAANFDEDLNHGGNQAAESVEVHYSFLQRQAMRMARWPKIHFWVAFAISFGLSAVGMVLGDFSVSTEGGGWQSRGTLIANRETQLMMVTEHRDILFDGTEEAWEDLINNVQPGWEEEDTDEDRRLSEVEAASTASIGHKRARVEKKTRRAAAGTAPKALHSFLARRLQEDSTGAFDGCDTEWYTDGRLTNETRLWPVWKVPTKTDTALEPETLKELCIAEETTQRVLEERGLCFGCEGEGSAARKCLPPHSIVLYARLAVPNGLLLDCDGLANAWAPYRAETEAQWKECVQYIETTPSAVVDGGFTNNCPHNFYPSLLDEFFDSTGNVEYTSSIFATTDDMTDDLYEINAEFGKGGVHIEGAYDTQNEDFVGLLAEGAVGNDMLLATGSALITTIAMLVHTRSPFLTFVGLVQIIMSFPLSFFVYRFIGQWNFFPFLNFIGVFVVFAMGADHVFVAVDKWKNARNDNPSATTEQIAAKALPDAASAMFLTTSTTAVAFFGTAICPVAPVQLFSIFCGLLITFDYILDVVLLFPCLCIYDGYRHTTNCCCVGCHCCCKRSAGHENEQNESEAAAQGGTMTIKTVQKTSLIRRILLAYYNIIYTLRWPLLVLSTGAFIVCCVYATKLGLPLSSDVRVLRSSVEYERAYLWRLNLLYEAMEKKTGSEAQVIWGVIPADTGDRSDPASWSTLVLDESFDPSTPAAQGYLKAFCPAFFAQDFATEVSPEYECSMNKFENWLMTQSSALQDADAIYVNHCAGASSLPMPSEHFHACLSAWSIQEDERNVLSRNGIVKVIYFPFRARVRYDSPNKELDEEWKQIENWMTTQQETVAPVEVSKAYFSSPDFWWYDTNTAMFRTAYGSAAIALAAAGIVILLSSRSLVMTLFSILSIGYVLTSVTSMMVAVGWDLGFLESICFAILIGVSVDFVIHFSHAYTSLQGQVDKEIRTKHALIDMGPSILAAAFTTLAGATIMLFCVVTFFTKFAMVLFFTIVQAMIGSFVVFLTLTNCIGPAQPTYLADQLVAYCQSKTTNKQHQAKPTKTAEDDDDERTESVRVVDVY